MEDTYEALLFYDELSPTQREQLRDRMDDDPDLTEAFVQWRQIHEHVRRRFHEAMPSRRLLVLYALDDAGHTDILSEDERTALEEARASIDEALEAHPSLRDVVARIQDEQSDFEAMWAERMSEEVESQVRVETDGEATRADRSSESRTRTARSPRPPARDKSRRWTRRAAVGAMVAAVIALVVVVWPSGSDRTTVQVAEGETNVVELQDGSRVRLVGESELTYASGEAFDRRVVLRHGRVFFDVQGEASGTPFVVTTPTATTTVLGTQFGMEADAEQTSVVLAEGRVEVGTADNSDAKAVVLSPGQRSRVDRGGTPTPPEAVNVTEALEWTGLFVFRATPTKQIVEQLRRHYDVEVTVASVLRTEAVTGTFEREQPVDQVLNAIATTLGADVQGNATDGFRLVTPEE